MIVFTFGQELKKHADRDACEIVSVISAVTLMSVGHLKSNQFKVEEYSLCLELCDGLL